MSQPDDPRWSIGALFTPPFFYEKPRHVGVAVSGGSDSMALLSHLCLWANEAGVWVSAMTVDHGLRDGSAAEATQVAAFCTGRGITHTTLHWTGWDGTGNLQAQARDARYTLMANHAAQTGIDVIALGHTQDDQAETFLMRLARKSGVDGLAQMDASFRRHNMHWVRPVLSRSRADLRAHLRAENIDWVDDPSNDDMRFDRVQARKALAELAPLGLDATALAAVSLNLSSARDALEHFTGIAAQEHAETQAGDLLLPQFSGQKADLPEDISRRLTVAAIQWIGQNPYAPRGRALHEMDEHLAATGTHVLAGCHITQAEMQTRYTREFNAVRDVVASTQDLWDGRWLLDGPHEPDLETRALGEDGLLICPDWRDTGLPRTSLVSTPAIWRGDSLVAAPVAGLKNGWSARLERSFIQFLHQRRQR